MFVSFAPVLLSKTVKDLSLSFFCLPKPCFLFWADKASPMSAWARTHAMRVRARISTRKQRSRASMPLSANISRVGEV